ncbi:MFS transporter [Archaeoglobales archaeon]|nr:MAG: MFS transporter [Archaeoglobales archaeon]
MRDRVLPVIFAITLIGVIGVAILAPAFPKIAHELNLSKSDVALLVTLFTLPGVVLAPIIGIMADRYGRKEILIPSLFLFGVAGTLCAFVDFRLMLILRFLQGIGGAALTSLAATLIGDLYYGMDRAKALGYNASILSIGTASYPLAGGLLALFDWRYPFFTFILAIPVGIAAMTIPYKEIRQVEFKSYAKESMRLLKNSSLLLGFVSGIIVFVILYGAFITYLPFLLNIKFMADSATIGIVQSSMSIVTAITASKIDFFLRKFGEDKTIKLGSLFYMSSMLLTPFIPSLWLFIAVTILFGLGHGTVLPAIQNLVVSVAPTENRAIVMTVYGSMVRIGQTVGPLIAAFIAYYSLDAVFIFSAILAAIAMLLYQILR